MSLAAILVSRFHADQSIMEGMKARYQYRFYPTTGQQRELAKLFGCCRVVWNDALALCRQAEKLPKNSDLQKQCITQAKQTPERAWLAEVSNIPLQQSIADLGVAYRNFFQSIKGKRKGAKVNPPRFKKRNNRQAARLTRGGFSLKGNKVYLAKIGQVKVRWSRALPSEPSSVTIIKDSCGRYFLSFVVEVMPKVVPFIREFIGVDLNIREHVASNGERFKLPKFKAMDRRIARLQRRWSRQQKGSNRREAMRLKIAKLKARKKNILKDALHKFSTRLVRENQVVCLEDLNVKGMVRNHCLARAISECGFGMLRSLVESKVAQHEDREVRIIDRWEPSSQVCHICRYRWGKLDLSIREIRCLQCGTVHDRDSNSSHRIEQSGMEQSHDSKRIVRAGKTGIPAQPIDLSSHGKEIGGIQLCLQV